MHKVRKTKTLGRKVKRKHPTPFRFEITPFEIAKLDVQPGDIIVLRTDLLLTQDQCVQLKERAEEQFTGFKVVVLTAGMSLAVLRDERRAA